MAKLVRFASPTGPRYGIMQGAEVAELATDPFGSASLRPSERVHELRALQLLAPAAARNIVSVLIEPTSSHGNTGSDVLLATKPGASIVGPDAPIRLPREGRVFGGAPELAAIIGTPCRNLPLADVPKHILGYTAFNNVCALDIFERNKSWVNASAFGTFAPVGPAIATELEAANTEVAYYVNGTLADTLKLRDIQFDFARSIAFISRIMTLMPGDLVTTGRRTGFQRIKAGDNVDVRIDGVGTLSNPVVGRTYGTPYRGQTGEVGS